jgi:hypothetical protein
MAERYIHDVRRREARLELDEDQWATHRPIRPGPRLVNPNDAEELQVASESEAESDE